MLLFLSPSANAYTGVLGSIDDLLELDTVKSTKVTEATADVEVQKAKVPMTPSWVVALAAHPTQRSAQRAAEQLKKRGVLDVAVLWIPDYASLSGAQAWLVYAGPYAFSEKQAVRARLKRLKRIIPGVYAIKLAHVPGRITLQ